MAKSKAEATIETAETQTPGAIPKGRSPQEFLKDEHLPGFYTRQIEEADPGDPAVPDLIRAAGQSARAAAGVAANIAEQEALDEYVLARVEKGEDELDVRAELEKSGDSAVKTKVADEGAGE